MRIVSPFLKRVLYPAFSAAGVFPGASASGLAVVTYHGVLPQGYQPLDAALDGNLVSAGTLRRQLRLLKTRYNVLSPEEVLSWREGRTELPPRAVLLTCDDGLLNCLTDMLPVLKQNEVHCLFFVTGNSTEDARTTLWYEDLLRLFLRGRAGRFEVAGAGITISDELASREQRRNVWWKCVKRLSQVDVETRRSFLSAARSQLNLSTWQSVEADNTALSRRFGLLTRPELCELEAAGMTIGAHTLSHPMLSQAPPDLARCEIAESRSRLASKLQSRVWAFAYPFGDAQSITPEVMAMAQEAGYSAAFLNFGGGLGTGLPPYAMPRVHVTSEMSLTEFEAHVSGFHTWLQRRTGRI
jgi:peptidoglycan/xylan/chitin deacetylase (PgdA/CDA1 family)